MMQEVLNALLAGQSLSRKESERVLDRMLDGPIAPEQIGAFLMLLRLRGESVDEIVGFVDCLRKRAIPVSLGEEIRETVVDVCGTGGDGSGTFNVSTAVAFVLAGAGLKVAKHGNRSVSSRCGSFDVLEKMGIYLESDPKKVAHSIDEFGIGFLFAPAFHPALKVLGSLRKNLGVSTVFNILGPLLNPVNVKRQLVGVYNYKLLNKMAEVLRALGSEEAFVVWGEDGLDELSLSAPTQIAHLKAGKIVSSVVRPEECGFRSVSPQVLKGGTAADNAGMIESIFKGERGPKRDWVLLNSAAGLMVGGKVANFKEGVELAEETIDSGRVLQILQKMRTL